MRHEIALALELEHTAWERYSAAHAACSRPRPGDQVDLFDPTRAVCREWLGIWLACAAEADRLGAPYAG